MRNTNDGYEWLLENCGDPAKVDHAAHIDDQETESSCFYCMEGL